MDRIVLVTKPSALDELIRKYHTEGAAEFALQTLGQSIAPYRREHAAYAAAMDKVVRGLPADMPVTHVSRAQLPHFQSQFREKDLVIVCGPDGLFANLAKYLGEQPVIAVNPDPRSIGGALMLHSPRAVSALIANVRAGKYAVERLPFVKASLDDGRVVWGINDIFIGRRDHVSARYEIFFGGAHEPQSSSGVIVSTGVGSTGWLRSVAAMVEAISGESDHALADLPDATSDELVFVVREPFPSPTSKTSIVTGRITPDLPLKLVCNMPTGGCLFSDGVVERSVEWNAGSTVVITVGDRHVQRIIR